MNYFIIFLYILGGGAILSLPSIWNGFPLMYYDSGYFILHGTKGVAYSSMLWRPLTYSYLIKLGLLSGSLLGVVFIQNILVSALLYLFSNTAINNYNHYKHIIVCFSLFLTPLPIYSNFILPDLFSGMMVVSLVLLFSVENIKKKFLFFFSTLLFAISHYSNLIAYSILTVSQLFWKFRAQKALVGVVLLLPWVILPMIHYSINKRFTVSNVAHLIFHSRLVTLKISNDYLNEKCIDNTEFKLCGHRDLGFHIWNQGPGTQIYALGGLDSVMNDVKRINYDILTSQFLISFISRSVINVATQLSMFISPIKPSLDSDLLTRELSFFSQLESHKLKFQRINPQNVASIRSILKWVYSVVLIISVILILFWLNRRVLNPTLDYIFVFTIITYFLNAVVCGILTDPDPRYSERFIWIIPWVALIHILSQINIGSRKTQKT